MFNKKKQKKNIRKIDNHNMQKKELYHLTKNKRDFSIVFFVFFFKNHIIKEITRYNKRYIICIYIRCSFVSSFQEKKR